MSGTMAVSANGWIVNYFHGDCLELMKDIPDKSVDLTVTSPPL